MAPAPATAPGDRTRLLPEAAAPMSPNRYTQ